MIRFGTAAEEEKKKTKRKNQAHKCAGYRVDHALRGIDRCAAGTMMGFPAPPPPRRRLPSYVARKVNHRPTPSQHAPAAACLTQDGRATSGTRRGKGMKAVLQWEHLPQCAQPSSAALARPRRIAPVLSAANNERPPFPPPRVRWQQSSPQPDWRVNGNLTSSRSTLLAIS